jgi:dGTPase
MEVASIARTVCRALRLHEDLVEALALLHDIGHPPFGHAGEEALNSCLVDEGGFSHNAYALTLVEQLECRPAAYPGLNLTHEVRAGQRARISKGARPRLLEVQIVDVADSITYTAHDVDDALKLGLVTLEKLCRCELIAGLLGRITAHYGELAPAPLRRALVHDLIDCQVTSVLQKTLPELTRRNWSTAQEALASGYEIGPAADLAAQLAVLQQFLYDHVYRHEKLLRVRQQAQNQIRELFAYFVRHPGRLPSAFQHHAESVGLRRSAADYLAGMTDRFCRRTFDQVMSGP